MHGVVVAVEAAAVFHLQDKLPRVLRKAAAIQGRLGVLACELGSGSDGFLLIGACLVSALVSLRIVTENS